MKKMYSRPETQNHGLALASIVCQSRSVKNVDGNADVNYGGGGHGAARVPQYKGVYDE